ncbi:MAG: hypothetical protein LBR43_00570 [Spiroplasmataceae bacterium]|nr:hypothetical protein [Spiroplasmataceae bacterium]
MTGGKQKQEQIMTSAYEMEVIQKSFTNTLRWLEFYIEKSGFFSDWQKQIPESIKRQDLNNQPNEIKGFMEVALLALDGIIDNKPDFIVENLQEQFYSWLDKSGIRNDNCPRDLNECLTNIHKVLNKDGKEFAERVDREADEDIARMTPEERRENFRKTFTLAQKLMDVAEARKKELEGKTYRDVKKNKFSGNSGQGKRAFGQIFENFQRPQYSLIEDIKRNIGQWQIEEIVTFNGHRYDWERNQWVRYDNEKREKVLLHQSIGEIRYYDWGGLEIVPNKIHCRSKFSEREWNEIEQSWKDFQYNLAQRKLRGEISLENWETWEGLRNWVAELERSQRQARVEQSPFYDWYNG